MLIVSIDPKAHQKYKGHREVMDYIASSIAMNNFLNQHTPVETAILEIADETESVKFLKVNKNLYEFGAYKSDDFFAVYGTILSTHE